MQRVCLQVGRSHTVPFNLLKNSRQTCANHAIQGHDYQGRTDECLQ